MLYALVFVYIACYIMVSGIVSFITKALNERRWLLRRLVIKSFLICWSAKVGLLTKYVRKNLLARAHWQQLKMVREVLTAKQLRDCVRYWSVSQGSLWNMSQKRRHPRNSPSLPAHTMDIHKPNTHHHERKWLYAVTKGKNLYYWWYLCSAWWGTCWIDWRPDLLYGSTQPETSGGVREYWIVDPDKDRITVYHFEADDMNEYSFTDDVPVGIYPGFSINLLKLNIWPHACCRRIVPEWQQAFFISPV